MRIQIATSLMLFLVGTSCVIAQERNEKRGTTGEVALSNDSLELRYIGAGDEISSASSHVTGAFFLSEDRDIVLSAGLFFPGYEAGQLSLMFGPQVYAALLDEDNNDVLSLTVGLEARFLINRKLGLAVSGKAFYGPDILTFGTADNLTDLSARVEMQVAPRMQAFAGMRWFEFDLTQGAGTTTLMEEIFVGAGYRF